MTEIAKAILFCFAFQLTNWNCFAAHEYKIHFNKQGTIQFSKHESYVQTINVLIYPSTISKKQQKKNTAEITRNTRKKSNILSSNMRFGSERSAKWADSIEPTRYGMTHH